MQHRFRARGERRPNVGVGQPRRVSPAIPEQLTTRPNLDHQFRATRRVDPNAAANARLLEQVVTRIQKQLAVERANRRPGLEVQRQRGEQELLEQFGGDDVAANFACHRSNL